MLQPHDDYFNKQISTSHNQQQLPNFNKLQCNPTLQSIMQKSSFQLNVLRKTYEEYLQYEKTHQIPPKIRDKLVCLIKFILKEPIVVSDYPSLDPDELNQLEKIEPAYKIKLFLSVSSCLMGKEEVDFVNSRQAFIKKDSFWSSWKHCYITYTNELLLINRNNQREELPFKRLRILSKVKQSGQKFVFVVEYDEGRYKIGFEGETVAKQYRQKIKTLISNIRRKNSKKELREERDREREENTVTEHTNMEKESMAPSDIDSDSDKDYLEQFDIENIQNETNFKILKHTDNGRIMVHRDNPQIFKSFLLAECTDPTFALESFMKTEQWSEQISQSKIISRLQQNSYIVYQCYRSTGYLTRARDYVLLKMALKKKNRYLLLEKSVVHPDYPEYKLSVRGEIRKKVTAFLPHPTNKKLLLMITEIDVDFRGYNSAEDTKNLMLKHFESYDKFSKYLIQKEFVSPTQRLFDFQTKHRINKVIFESCKSFQLIKEKEEEVIKPLVEEKKVSLVDEFRLVLPKEEYQPISNKFIELVLAQVNHYYCISHRYSFDIDSTKSLLHIKNNDTDTILLGDWLFKEDGEIEFINEKAIAAQKDVIKYIFKQIGSNILKGKSIMSMSLPVDIFDNKSLLERMMGSYGYVPIFITKAAESTNEVEQVKLIALFLATYSILQMKLEKPFNPILGETFQGYIGGIPIYIEQISHHPPISAVYMETPAFKIYGNLEAKVDMGLNTISGYCGGLLHIEFKSNNTHFECTMPGMELSGLMAGSRKYRLANKVSILERRLGLYCEFSFGKDKKDLYVSKQKMKPCDVMGGIFKITEQAVKRIYTEVRKQHKYNGINKKDVIEKLGEISGSWNGSVLIDGEVVHRLYDPMPYRICYVDYPLPSDSNFREDLMFRRMGNFGEAQNAKEKLENIQRNDRKLRGKKH